MSTLSQGIANYWAFVVAVIVFLAIPGPGNLAIIASTGQGRIAGGLAAALGVIAGDQVLLWAAVAGLAALLAAHTAIFTALQYAGALYLAYLGLKMLLARPGAAAIFQMQPQHFFRQSFFITLLNPKAVMFYMAFFPLFVDPAQAPSLQTFAVMASTIAALTFLYCLALTLLTHFAARQMQARPRLSVWLSQAAGLILLVFSIKLLAGK